jgi:hypothetical protein
MHDAISVSLPHTMINSLVVVLLSTLPAFTPQSSDLTLLQTLRAKGILTAEEYEALARRFQQSSGALATEQDQLDDALARIERERGAPDRGRASPAVTVTHVPGAGFTFETQDGRFATTIGGWAQVRTQYSNPDGSGGDEWTFEVEHARLFLQGHAFETWFQYVFEFDLVGQSSVTDVQGIPDASGNVTEIETTQRQAASLTDGYFDIVPIPEFGTRAGQFKVPYSRQELISDSKQELPDRSITSNFFSLGRQEGVDLHGAVDTRFFYNLGIYNGAGENAGVNTNGTTMLYDVRLGVMPLGDDATYLFTEEGDLRRSDRALLGLETAYAWDNRDADDRNQVELSGLFKGFGLALEAAYLARHIDPTSGSSTDDNGYYAQIGYMLTECLEGVYRNAYLHIDQDEKQAENTVGANYYFRGQSLKVQASYRRVSTNPTQGSRENADLWILQLQAAF